MTPNRASLYRKDVNQSSIYIGHLGIDNLNPDWYAIRIMNRIYGVGTFTSRLGKEIRSARGLAYSVGGGVTRGPAKGPFISLPDKAQTTVEAIAAMLDITRKMREGPILDEEFEFSKNRLINSDVFNYASSSAIVDQKLLQILRLPDDYLESYIVRTRPSQRTTPSGSRGNTCTPIKSRSSSWATRKKLDKPSPPLVRSPASNSLPQRVKPKPIGREAAESQNGERWSSTGRGWNRPPEGHSG